MTSPQKWTTGQDSAEQPGIAERPLPSPADDAPTQPDDVPVSKSTRTEYPVDEPQAIARHERKAGSSVASGSPPTESMSDVTTEAPAATRTSTPSQQKLSALMAVRVANDKAIEDARLQLKAEADAASGSPNHLKMLRHILSQRSLAISQLLAATSVPLLVTLTNLE